MAQRALGLTARERNDITASVAHLRHAIRVAEQAGLPEHAAEARMSISGTLVMRGDWRGALREADRAAEHLTGVALARLQVQRATVLMDQGRLEEALRGYQCALPELRRAGDTLWLARLFNNRGLLYCQMGDLSHAQADLERAEQLHQELGQQRSVAHARQNLGLVASLRGDVVAALAFFDDADTYFRAVGAVDAAALDERCLALVGARLLAEAREAAETAVKMLEKEGRRGYLAMARLRLAECALLQDDLTVAIDNADAARRAFLQQRRLAWAALARTVGLRAAWLNGEASTSLVDTARRTAESLANAGFTVQAVDAEILTAQIALDAGRRELARRTLARARRSRSKGPVQLRSRAWHAEALLRLADGDRRAARSALRAGMAVLDSYRAALGATELRAQASGHGADLAALGLRLAVEDGSPERVLAWAERWRGSAMRLRPARPPEDADLALQLAELRSVAAAADSAVLEGRSTTKLLSRQAMLETAVRRQARQATGLLAASLELPPTLASLAAALGPQALVEIVDSDGMLHAAVVSGDGRASLHRLAPETEVSIELERLLASLRRLVYGPRSEASMAASASAVSFGARRLDEMLLVPLARRVGDRPLVLVPTGLLHAMPWSALPSCAGRPVSVAPSATVWHRAASASTADGGVVLVAGPGPPNAVSEVRALARGYRPARVLTGDKATASAVCQALDGARLAHVAAHGRFRSDNPLFSCLELADGPLTVYDLEALGRAPQAVVLSACESGLSDVRPGDELMGLAAALFALGTRTLVASVLSVPDATTRPLMLDLHRGLRAGLPAAEALVRAQARAAKSGAVGVATAAAFVCFGANG